MALLDQINQNIDQILNSYKNVAVVGLSNKPYRPSYSVAAYLQQAGYRIIPVNPAYQEILGEKCYPSLSAVPESIEIVDIFRRPEHVLPVVEEAIAVGARVIWMQSGIVNMEAAQLALKNGLQVVMDLCMKVEHNLRLL